MAFGSEGHIDFGPVTFPHMVFHSAVTTSTTFVESLPPSLDCKYIEGFIIIHSALADQDEGNHILRVDIWNHIGRNRDGSSVFMAVTTI